MKNTHCFSDFVRVISPLFYFAEIFLSVTERMLRILEFHSRSWCCPLQTCGPGPEPRPVPRAIHSATWAGVGQSLCPSLLLLQKGKVSLLWRDPSKGKRQPMPFTDRGHFPAAGTKLSALLLLSAGRASLGGRHSRCPAGTCSQDRYKCNQWSEGCF